MNGSSNMDMNLKDIVGLFDSTASRQMTFWNIYWIVAIGVLAFLWKEPRDRPLKITLIVGFVVFWLSNLFVVASLQTRLVDIAAAVRDYVASVPTAIDPKLRSALKGMEAFPLTLVIAFHFFVSVAFTLTMMFSRVSSSSQQPSAESQDDE